LRGHASRFPGRAGGRGRRENQRLPAPFEQDDGNCSEEDVGVKEEGAFLYVEVIVFELVLWLEVIKGTNLGKASNTWFDGKPDTLQGPVSSDEVRAFGSRADQTHIAPQDVEELRKLIKTRSSEYFAERSDPPIISGSPDGAGTFLGIVDHCPELVEDEDFAVFANPSLFEQNRAGRSNSYENRGKQHHRGSERQHNKRAGNIKAPDANIINYRSFVRFDDRGNDSSLLPKKNFKRRFVNCQIVVEGYCLCLCSFAMLPSVGFLPHSLPQKPPQKKLSQLYGYFMYRSKAYWKYIIFF
jgi:hypothetical protein